MDAYRKPGKFYRSARERLILWAAQLGWLHSTPDRKRKDDRRTRSEQYGKGHPYTFLPDVQGFDYLVSAFREAGMSDAGMGGPIVLSWGEIQAFNCITGNAYSRWDVGVIRDMSESYVAWYHKGGKQLDVAEDVPYIERNEETLAVARASVARNLENCGDGR